MVAWWTAPRLLPLPKVDGPVTFEQVRAIVGQRCVTCHAPTPTFSGIAQPPAGVVLHTAESIGANAQRIYQQVVATRIMPLGNVTQITDDERAIIAAWIAGGAKTKLPAGADGRSGRGCTGAGGKGALRWRMQDGFLGSNPVVWRREGRGILARLSP